MSTTRRGFAVAFLCLSAVTAMAADMPLTFTEPYILSLHPSTEMSICWITSEPVTDAYVEYGPTPSYGQRVAAIEYKLAGLKKSPDETTNYDPDPAKNPDLAAYQQIARLVDLKPGQVYYYRVFTATHARAKAGPGYYFRTAPTRDRPANFVLLSDLQQKAQINSTVKMAGQMRPDFIIYSGDLQNTPWKSSEWFPVPGVYAVPAEKGKEWFPVMQQTEGGARLLQYAPIFPTPGNHELDDQRALTDKTMALDTSKWSLSIYMQIFRPLYPEQEYGAGGKHWYSADFADLHIVSLSAFRWHPWAGDEAPGWQIFDDLKPGSPQYEWLLEDLTTNESTFKWVTLHWHMMNRGVDGHTPFSPPVVEGGKVKYPEPDYCHHYLKPLFELCGVNAVSFGHSHVYERYRINGVHYIEAATIGNTYRADSDPLHPSGIKPVIEENRFRSFLHLRFSPVTGFAGMGVQASVEPNGPGYLWRVFDNFNLLER